MGTSLSFKDFILIVNEYQIIYSCDNSLLPSEKINHIVFNIKFLFPLSPGSIGLF
jgi:hypothetical protein